MQKLFCIRNRTLAAGFSTEDNSRAVATPAAELYAYLAGAIDADGFITISRSTPSKTRRDGRRSTYYTAKIGLSEIKATIPDLLQGTFGGWRGIHVPKDPRHRPWHLWQATNQLAASALRHLLPHLRLKRRQAQLVIEFAARTARTRRGPIGDDERGAREHLYVEVTRLNDPRNRRVHPPVGNPYDMSGH